MKSSRGTFWNNYVFFILKNEKNLITLNIVRQFKTLFQKSNILLRLLKYFLLLLGTPFKTVGCIIDKISVRVDNAPS